MYQLCEFCAPRVVASSARNSSTRSAASFNTVLASDKRPKGERVGQVFRADWKEGRALYAPWDRMGLAEHPGWAAAYPLWAWHPGRDISFFLKNVHELLNDDDYKGI